MINPFRPLWAALRDVFDDFFLLLLSNLLWCLLSLPLLWVAYAFLVDGMTIPAYLLILLNVLPAGPASAALAHVALRVSEGRATRIGAYIGAVRDYARRGWILLGIWTVGLLVLLIGIGFSLSFGSLIGAIMLGLWLYLLIMWLSALIYLFPLMALQEQFSLGGVARSAALMVIGRPIFTIVNLALMLAALALSLTLVAPLLMFTPALLSVWGMRATRALIDDARRRREAAEAQAEPSPIEEKGRKGQVRPK